VAQIQRVDDVMGVENFDVNLISFMDSIRQRVAVPETGCGEPTPAYNAAETIGHDAPAGEIILWWRFFRELGLSAYSCEDLFHQQTLLDGCLDALSAVLKASPRYSVITCGGMPLQVHSMLSTARLCL